MISCRAWGRQPYWGYRGEAPMFVRGGLRIVCPRPRIFVCVCVCENGNVYVRKFL